MQMILLQEANRIKSRAQASFHRRGHHRRLRRRNQIQSDRRLRIICRIYVHASCQGGEGPTSLRRLHRCHHCSWQLLTSGCHPAIAPRSGGRQSIAGVSQPSGLWKQDAELGLCWSAPVMS